MGCLNAKRLLCNRKAQQPFAFMLSYSAVAQALSKSREYVVMISKKRKSSQIAVVCIFPSNTSQTIPDGKRCNIVKRMRHRVRIAFLLICWFILFILMQLVSFDWSDKNELRLCLLIIGFFLLQLSAIRCFQKQRASRIITAFSIIYGVLFIKDVCFTLAVIRPNWHGPLALFFTCLLCDLTGFILCRSCTKKISQGESCNTKQIEIGT